MSQNPYGDDEGRIDRLEEEFDGAAYYDDGDGGMGVPAQRTSALAISSLIFSLACCIPGAGLLGVVLGGAGLLAIGRSNGRLSGSGFAATGIVVGLIVSVLWLAGTFGFASMFRLYAEMVTERIEIVERGDWNAVRSALAPDQEAKADDATLEDFRARYRDALGEYRSASTSLVDFMTGLIRQQRAAEPYMDRLGDRALVLPAQFDRGEALIVILLDPDRVDQTTGPIGPDVVENIGIIYNNGRDSVWLFPLEGDPRTGAPPPDGGR